MPMHVPLPQLSKKTEDSCGTRAQKQQVLDKVVLHWLVKMFLQKQGRTDRHGEGKVSWYISAMGLQCLTCIFTDSPPLPLVTIPIYPPLRYSEACQRHDQHTD